MMMMMMMMEMNPTIEMMVLPPTQKQKIPDARLGSNPSAAFCFMLLFFLALTS